MKHSKYFFQLFIISALFLISCKEKETIVLQVNNLRTEMLVNPEGTDALNPKLTWELSGDKRGIIQTAYRILDALRSVIMTSRHLLEYNRIMFSSSAPTSRSGSFSRSGNRPYFKKKLDFGFSMA